MEIPPSLRDKFNVKDYQVLTVTIEIENDNMWDTVIESARQSYKDLKMRKPIPTIQDVLKSHNPSPCFLSQEPEKT